MQDLPSGDAFRWVAVVAAAGAGRRMGRPKQLLPWGNGTVLGTVLASLHAAGAAACFCVLGHKRQAVRAALKGAPAHFVDNPQFAAGGMGSSFQAGLRAALTAEALDAAWAGALLALGDQPHLDPTLYAQLLALARAHPGAIVAPSYARRRGHPLYLPRALWAEVLDLGQGSTVRDVLQRHAGVVHHLACPSDAVLLDMDTPEDYRALRARFDVGRGLTWFDETV